VKAYQLTPEYEKVWEPSGRRWIIELDEYEIVNLQRLLDAVAGKTKEHDVSVTSFNNGDWVGQIGFYLPKTSGRIKPNAPYPPEAA